MASIRQRPNGSWEVRVRRRGYTTLARTFDSEREATKWARQAETELAIRRGATPDTNENRMTLGEALDLYEQERTNQKRGAEMERYRIGAWNRRPLAKMPLGQIGSHHIAQFVADRRSAGRGGQTIRKEVTIISDLFNHARIAWGMTTLRNPVTGVKLPPLPQHRERRLQQDEEGRLLAECGPELKAAVLLALETGMRRAEIAGLRWGHIDIARRIVKLPQGKTGRRDVPLSSVALDTLRSLPRRLDGTAFSWEDPHSLTRAFERACHRAKIEGLTFHDLRHECLSRLAERGFDIPRLAVVSGHRSWAALKRYVNLRAEDVAKELG